MVAEAVALGANSHERPSSEPHSAGQPAIARPTVRYFGDYELLEEIARGGMGVVWKARQTSLNRVVALKMILSGHFAGAAEVRRFRAEAEAAANLQHPNIVAIHEVGEHDGQHYFSMDYVGGRSLAEVVRDGPLPAKRAAGYVKTIAEAIHYAHSKGVLHRDLKPSNVLMDTFDQPRVTDFGLAKRLPESGLGTQTSDLTLSGQVLGTAGYMPPEQAGGKRGEIGRGCDIYSLGALLYHLVTGRPPFVAESLAATLRLAAEAEPVSPRLLVPNLPKDLETICLKCLQKEAPRRYSSAEELAEELGRFLRDEPIRARPVGRGERLHRWIRRHPVSAALSGIVGLLVLAVAVVSTVAAAHLRRAHREGQEKLREAYLSQARVHRWSGQPGRRFASLDAIRQAVAIRPGLDLRNEAIAALALVDLRHAKQWPLANGSWLVFDAAYERYARAETNGMISIRRIRDEAELLRVAGFGLPVNDFAFSPDGRWLGAHYRGGKSYAFKVYDLQNHGRAMLDLPGRWVRCFSFLPDHRKLALFWATWTEKKSTSRVTFYDLDTGQEVNSIPLPNLPYGVAAHPDASRVAIGSPETPLVHIYSVADGQKQQTLVHSNGVYGLSWSQDGRRLAAACGDQFVYIWNLSGESPTAMLLPHEGTAIWCQFTQRGDLLLSWGWNLIAKIWNVESGKELLRMAADGMGHFSLDDRWVNLNRVPRCVSISEFADARECRAYHFQSRSGGTHCLALSPDGRWMASGHRDGLRLWNLATGRQFHHPEAGETSGLQFAPDGQSLITQAGNALWSWPVRSRDENGTTRIEVGPSTPLSSTPADKVYPSHRIIAVVKGQACLFDTRSLRMERRLTRAQNVHAASLSPDGRHCATWPLNAESVEIWDAEDGHPVTSLATPPSPCVGFSADGRWLITGSAEEYTFWDRTSWQVRKQLPRGLTGGAHGKCAFTRNGSMVALAVGRGEVSLFDTSAFESLATLEGPENNTITGLAFSADGAHLAVSSTVQSIYVWDLRAVRRQLADLKLDWALPALPEAAETGANATPTVTVVEVPKNLDPAPTNSSPAAAQSTSRNGTEKR
jgi:WD40 repeat protein/tRNA A-37 threonylcarbamoyl transferase component Bud32